MEVSLGQCVHTMRKGWMCFTVKSFHDDMKGTALFYGATSNPATSLVAWSKAASLPLHCLEFFATLLKHSFGESTEGIYLWTRSDRNLFKLSRLRAKTRVHEKYVRDLLFADDAAITTHIQENVQQLLDRFSEACRHFGLTISLAKTQAMGQDIKEIPSLFIHNCKTHKTCMVQQQAFRSYQSQCI